MTLSWAWRERRRWLVVACCVVAAGLTVAGSFLPLFVSTTRLGYPLSVLKVIVTGWGVQATANGLPDRAPDIEVAVNGVPLVLAAALLLLAVVKRGAALAGAGFLAGTVLTIWVQESTWPEVFRPAGILVTMPNLAIDLAVGSGFHVLVAAVLVAGLAALLALRPAVAPEREEPDTPPLGVPVVVRLPDEPPAQR
ncbi:MAG TPA: hypothetical protein VGR06_16820 [Actinophytocola sp.]|uniref:hypothetical protein n=1 Tax=Actinophytocola sp. TaxID=1872138 RepID=UPI002E02BA42|nr:hypothetical protein [Actinophytocola sp.]